MKKKRFSVEQIATVLKQAELGVPVAELIRQTGISEQTFFRWEKQYAGLHSDEVRELRQRRDENARLKKLVAELSLDKTILQDFNAKKMARPSIRREAVQRPVRKLIRARGVRRRARRPAELAQHRRGRPGRKHQRRPAGHQAAGPMALDDDQHRRQVGPMNADEIERLRHTAFLPAGRYIRLLIQAAITSPKKPATTHGLRLPRPCATAPARGPSMRHDQGARILRNVCRFS